MAIRQHFPQKCDQSGGKYTYDAFGNATPGSDDPGRYGWTGRDKDAETKLQHNRGRWYDASTGRWISQDPLGFDAGDSNLYRYVKNGPTLATDPSGLILTARDSSAAASYEMWFRQLGISSIAYRVSPDASQKYIFSADAKQVASIYDRAFEASANAHDRNVIEALLDYNDTEVYSRLKPDKKGFTYHASTTFTETGRPFSFGSTSNEPFMATFGYKGGFREYRSLWYLTAEQVFEIVGKYYDHSWGYVWREERFEERLGVAYTAITRTQEKDRDRVNWEAQYIDVVTEFQQIKGREWDQAADHHNNNLQHVGAYETVGGPRPNIPRPDSGWDQFWDNVPVVGNVRGMLYSMKNGEFYKGVGYLVLAVDDAFMVKSLGKGLIQAIRAPLSRGRMLAPTRLVNPAEVVGSTGPRIPYSAEQVARLRTQIERMSRANGTGPVRMTVVQNQELLDMMRAEAGFIRPEALRNLSEGTLERFGLTEIANRGQGVIILGNRPGYATTIHEVFHMEHWMTNPLYGRASPIVQERYVFERMIQPSVWNNLSLAERTAEISRIETWLGRSGATGTFRQEVEGLIQQARSRLNTQLP